MIKELKYHDLTWIDLETPTKEDIDTVSKRFHLHPLVSNELANTSLRSRVDLYDDFIYLLLHFPNNKPTSTNATETSEIDFVIGKDFLITTHYEAIEPVDEFGKIIETGILMNRAKKDIHAGYLLFYLMRHLYQSLETNLDAINFKLRRAEKKIFGGHEKEMVLVLSNIHRQLLDFRWAIKSHREVLASLELGGKEFFGEKFGYYLKSIIGEYEKIWNLLESNRDLFFDLRNDNESMLNIKTNQTMKGLTMLAFVTFPLTLVAAVFGMNTRYMPLVGEPYDFWVVIAIMACMSLAMFLYFRLKKWI